MRYIKEVLKKNKRVTIAYILIGVMNSFLLSYKADYFKKIIDGLSAGSLTLFHIIGYGLVLLISYSMQYVDEYPKKKLEISLYQDFKLLAFQKISTIDYSEYARLGTGKLVQKIENGASAGQSVIYSFWLVLIRELIPSVIFSLYFITKINPRITEILLVGYLVIFVISNLLLKLLTQIKEKVLNNEELLNHYLVRGFMEMVVFRVERKFPEEIAKATTAKKEIVNAKVKMNMIHEAFFTIFALIVAVLNIGIIFYSWKSARLSAGEVVALLTLIENAYIPIAIFNVIYVEYKLDRSAYARFTQFLSLRDDKQLYKGVAPEGSVGDICIKNLSFDYEQKNLFHDLSLSIKKGEKIAFVGESGSGKSTLVKILMGLLKYDNGQIRIGDTQLRDMNLDQFYGKVAYLSQDTPIFDGTIRENITFDKNIPDEQLLLAFEKVQLSGLLKESNRNLDTQIGERGTQLSGGEKQRLAFARLWFENPELVILDEATSAMDNLTEESVMREVTEKLKDQTIIAIAHRLSSIASFDRIVVFRDGKITRQGSFQELLDSDEYFAELYRADQTA